jgi:high-affinity nickel-transport protein
MLGAYGWAQIRPVRKLYYNLSITLVSVLIALFIGGVEVMQIISRETGATSGPLGWASGLDFGSLGYTIICIFLASWLASFLLYRIRGIARLDEALVRVPAGQRVETRR